MCEKGYNFESDLDKTESEQFTRMVWKDNTKVGIGVAKKDITIDNLNLSCYFFVARYDDNPSKYFNSFKKNVLKGTFNKTICKELQQFADNEIAKRVTAAAKEVTAAATRSTGNCCFMYSFLHWKVDFKTPSRYVHQKV